MTSLVGLKSISAAGKSSTDWAVSWRTVFHESSTLSSLIIGFHCNRGHGIRKPLFAIARRWMNRGVQTSFLAFEQARDQRGPPGLVAGPQAPAILGVKVFEKPHQVAPVGILGEYAKIALPWNPAGLTGKKDARQPPAHLAR